MPFLESYDYTDDANRGIMTMYAQSKSKEFILMLTALYGQLSPRNAYCMDKRVKELVTAENVRRSRELNSACWLIVGGTVATGATLALLRWATDKWAHHPYNPLTSSGLAYVTDLVNRVGSSVVIIGVAMLFGIGG